MKKKVLTNTVFLVVIFVPVFVLIFTLISRESKADEKVWKDNRVAVNSETICPISCSADSKGWEVNFECEEKSQLVRKTYHKGYRTEFVNGKPSSQGDVEFKFEVSDNNYLVNVKTWPCIVSSTGYCIELKATGGAVGNNSSTCKNFESYK